MDWLYVINTFWGPVAVLGGLVAGAFTIWLMSKVPSKSSFDELDIRVQAHDRRLDVIEAHNADSPTRHELQEDIAELGSRMSAIEEGQRGIAAQLKTANDYLHIMIEKSIPGAAR